jgi:molecular chaperone DnaJ
MPVLHGHGRGDQRILVNVLVPRRLNDEQRRILREFEEHADERTYDKAGGLFDKLKSAFH